MVRVERFYEQRVHQDFILSASPCCRPLANETVCRFDVGREKVNCPAGARETGLGRDHGPPLIGTAHSRGRMTSGRLLPVSPFSTLFCGFPPDNLWKNILPQTSLENSLLFQQRVWKRKALRFLGFFGLSTIFFPITPFSKQYIFYSFL